MTGPVLLIVIGMISCVYLHGWIVTKELEQKNQRLARRVDRLSRLLGDLERPMNGIIDRVNRVDGLTSQVRLKARFAERYAQQAMDKSTDALTRVGAIEKATHRVQFMPLEKVLERNAKARNNIEKLLNPGDEPYEWNDPLEEDEEQ